jgi:hypothetical protein
LATSVAAPRASVAVSFTWKVPCCVNWCVTKMPKPL